MNAKIAIVAVLLAFAVSHCQASPAEDGEDNRQLQETGSELSDEEDIIEDMIEYVFAEEENVFTGRKKKHKKKLLKFLAWALLVKVILLPKIFALVKFLTAKAYLLSLVALVFAAAIITKKEEHNTEHVINLVPKVKGRSLNGQEQAYRYYWRSHQEEV